MWFLSPILMNWQQLGRGSNSGLTNPYILFAVRSVVLVACVGTWHSPTRVDHRTCWTREVFCPGIPTPATGTACRDHVDGRDVKSNDIYSSLPRMKWALKYDDSTCQLKHDTCCYGVTVNVSTLSTLSTNCKS